MGDLMKSRLFRGDDRERVDQFLTRSFPEHSRARMQALISAGHVQIDGVTTTKQSFLLENGMNIEIIFPDAKKSDLIPEDIPLTIIFENQDILIVNKPAGMVVHPSPGHDHGTLVNAALGYTTDLAGIGGEIRPGVVHRLDKETSGLIILAKNDQAHRWLQEQFKTRSIEKEYIALVDGAPPTRSGRVEAPIGRNHVHRKMMAIVPLAEGREAVSEYHTLTAYKHHTLLRVHPLTGRTHQIRVHMAYLGCPIVGDTIYGRKRPSLKITRHFLHAYKLAFILPGETLPRTFECELPDELIGIIQEVEQLT